MGDEICAGSLENRIANGDLSPEALIQRNPALSGLAKSLDIREQDLDVKLHMKTHIKKHKKVDSPTRNRSHDFEASSLDGEDEVVLDQRQILMS